MIHQKWPEWVKAAKRAHKAHTSKDEMSGNALQITDISRPKSSMKIGTVGTQPCSEQYLQTIKVPSMRPSS